MYTSSSWSRGGWKQYRAPYRLDRFEWFVVHAFYKWSVKWANRWIEHNFFFLSRLFFSRNRIFPDSLYRILWSNTHLISPKSTKMEMNIIETISWMNHRVCVLCVFICSSLYHIVKCPYFCDKEMGKYSNIWRSSLSALLYVQYSVFSIQWIGFYSVGFRNSWTSILTT